MPIMVEHSWPPILVKFTKGTGYLLNFFARFFTIYDEQIFNFEVSEPIITIYVSDEVS